MTDVLTGLVDWGPEQVLRCLHMECNSIGERNRSIFGLERKPYLDCCVNYTGSSNAKEVETAKHVVQKRGETTAPHWLPDRQQQQGLQFHHWAAAIRGSHCCHLITLEVPLLTLPQAAWSSSRGSTSGRCCSLIVLLQSDYTAAVWLHCCSLIVLLQSDYTAAVWLHCCSLIVLLQSDYTAAVWLYCCSLITLLLSDYIANTTLNTATGSTKFQQGLNFWSVLLCDHEYQSRQRDRQQAAPVKCGCPTSGGGPAGGLTSSRWQDAPDAETAGLSQSAPAPPQLNPGLQRNICMIWPWIVILIVLLLVTVFMNKWLKQGSG